MLDIFFWIKVLGLGRALNHVGLDLICCLISGVFEVLVLTLCCLILFTVNDIHVFFFLTYSKLRRNCSFEVVIAKGVDIGA